LSLGCKLGMLFVSGFFVLGVLGSLQ
jgi:hypothetical protein